MIKMELTMEGHDWENDLHFSYKIPVDMSLFERYPEAINDYIERARRVLEDQYKTMIIEKKMHLKVVK